ncbi:MAG: DUF6242 domain-containing protein [Tannerella sp.]|jgi:hypothetical protein|nr:DUF6242 domain-containing protein [Tannerella sp.]
MRKKNIQLWLSGCFLFLLPSCLGDNETEIDDWNLGNAQIATFSLSNDSIEGLSSVVFTIDQVNSKIFNRDSMPYGTRVDSFDRKLLCTLTFEVGAYAVLVVPQASGDSIWGVTDSIDFSQPVMITIYPYDGISTKTYEAKLNIHQVNPDSMIWQKRSDLPTETTTDDMKVITYMDSYYMYSRNQNKYHLYKADTVAVTAWEELSPTDLPADAVISQMLEFEKLLYVAGEDGKLYSSAEGQQWTEVAGAPELKSLLGIVPDGTVKSVSVISAIATVEGSLHHVAMSKDGQWTVGKAVEASFPVSGFSALSYEAMYLPRLMAVGGRNAQGGLSNKAWSTMDGLAWTPLSNERLTFTPREGASVVRYDNGFYLIGGVDDLGQASGEIYRSHDSGVTWVLTQHEFPEEYVRRGFASAIVNHENYILLFGGKAAQSTYFFNELWQGRLNRLL